MSAALQAVKQFRIRELAPLVKADPTVANARPKLLNPFLPHKNPESGRWAPPKYSLRRQADLVKQARASGMLHLLPPGPKLSPKEIASASASAPLSTSAPVTDAAEPVAESSKVWWSGEVEWQGEFKEKEVKGADVGNRLYAGKKRMFKGHKWERTLEKRTWERKMLMKDMQTRIERFRTVSALPTPSSCDDRLRLVGAITFLALLLLCLEHKNTPPLLMGRAFRPTCYSFLLGSDRVCSAGRRDIRDTNVRMLTRPSPSTDVPAQDAKPRQPCPAGFVLEASVLIRIVLAHGGAIGLILLLPLYFHAGSLAQNSAKPKACAARPACGSEGKYPCHP